MSNAHCSRVLLVDDKVELAETYAESLIDRGYQAETAASGRSALTLLEQEHFDVLVTDLRMPDLDGMALLSASKKLRPSRPVMLMTAYGAIDSAIEAVRAGAYHYLTKPFKFEELESLLRRALEESAPAPAAAGPQRPDEGVPLLGQSAVMTGLFEVLDRVAVSEVPVLLTGETGTGKGLLARTLHQKSARAKGPFVTVNCAALPEGLLESELFGYVRGAFTGAQNAQAGLFAEAEGGTLFLDEIGEFSLALQAKLLDVLERGAVRPLGATRERQVDVRIIAATNKQLSDMVGARSFRSDLLYRLDVLSLSLPPLRERREDIPLLVHHFLERLRARHSHSPVVRVSPEGMRLLTEYHWPGNVRELSHTLERLVILGGSLELGASQLAMALRKPSARAALEPASGITFGGEVQPIRDVQRRYAAWALKEFGGNQLRAAERLGIDRKTLAKWLSARKGSG